MRRDRLQAVLGVRERVERRRLAEHVGAQRELRQARREREAAERARDEAASPPASAAHVQLLVLYRLGGLAYTEEVDNAVQREVAARVRAERVGQLKVEASVARRSVERLQERRLVEEQRAEQRVADRRNDDVGLETWRRRS
jgi:hypothetical protein